MVKKMMMPQPVEMPPYEGSVRPHLLFAAKVNSHIYPAEGSPMTEMEAKDFDATIRYLEGQGRLTEAAFLTDEKKRLGPEYDPTY